jgi:hypothetical protein
METAITSGIDQAIEQFKSQHNGSNPLYCIMSAEEADELAETLRREDGHDADVMVTTYRDIKIIRNSLMERGRYLMTNELPETGS